MPTSKYRVINRLSALFRIFSLYCLCHSAFSHADTPTWQLVTEHFPPFSYEQQGQMKGFSSDLVKLLMEDNNLTYQFSLYPWARAYQLALDTPNTLLYSVGRTEEREASFYWVGPLASINVWLWQPPGDPALDLQDSQQMRKFRIAVIRKSAVEKKLAIDKRFTKENTYPVTEIEDALLMLSHRRVDGVLMASNMEKDKATLLEKLKDKVEKRQMVMELPLYAALHKASGKETAEHLQQSLFKLRGNGKYQQLLDEYGLGPELVMRHLK
ncbi:transporter substrate-binding domain-containing protein [Bowmanella denitrificans]|uniref:Transporter substrate-binding domain-containing protein n=1 Tax=Bowmanella denitrificans TaxID=366582 RepID=A0ABP3GQM3_9ALTE